jgi:hypothetical protein
MITSLYSKKIEFEKGVKYLHMYNFGHDTDEKIGFSSMRAGFGLVLTDNEILDREDLEKGERYSSTFFTSQSCKGIYDSINNVGDFRAGMNENI